MTDYQSHYSVLLPETIQAFSDASKDVAGPLFADMTFGGGGHTFAVAENFSDSIVYSVDQDDDALENGWKISKTKS